MILVNKATVAPSTRNPVAHQDCGGSFQKWGWGDIIFGTKDLLLSFLPKNYKI
jgi:hypothetical protein